MIKKIFFTIIWTITFFFGSAIILGFASGLYFSLAVSAGNEIDPEGQMIQYIGYSWAIVPMAMGPIGFCLSLLGKLPGTKINPAQLEKS
jgi:hypothetical protein